MKIDVKELGIDFLAFSGHKMLGPTGVGVLYGRAGLLDKMKPFLFGGEMISRVSFNESEWNDIPFKFEAGTPNIAGVIGLGKAVEYLNDIGMDNIESHCKELVKYCYEKLKEIQDIEIYSSKNSSLISFNIKNIHSHDVAAILDKHNIAVRAGHMCCQPLMKKLGIPAAVRASFYLYNNKKDIDALITALNEAVKFFRI